jgi:putative transposase
MSTPKHRGAPGSSYFVTTKCWQGHSVFQISETAEILIRTLFYYRDRNVYALHEFVIMPDHLHVLVTPAPKTSLERAIQFIKGGSSHRIHKERDQRMEIWQAGFYDWTIRDYNDWLRKVEYIHANPVRAKLVENPEVWPYSSANGKFTLDPIPAKYLTSGAKAQTRPDRTSELKLRPPKESNGVGPKGPTPNSFSKATNP